MWNWKPEKRILEDLFAAGEVVVAGRDGFQRLYDLPERVIPREQLDAPAPSEEEFRRGYALRAVQGRGALTESGIAEHCRFQGGAKAMRPVVDGLVDEGLVRRVAVDDGGAAGRRSRRMPSSTARRRAAFSSARSTTSSGTARSSSGSSASTHADRGLQAGAAAGVRLLRAAVPVRRPAASGAPT